MSSLKDSWNDAQQKAKSWIASVTGQEPKDYGKMIIGLDTPSLKDQTLILKVRTTYIYSTMVGSLVSTVAAFWACTKSGGAWMRWRLPVTFGAGWIGGIVGMKQAQIAAKNYIHAIEDPALRTVMLAHDAGRLSYEEDNLLRENVMHKLDTGAVYKHEAEKHDMSIRDRLEHLKSEQERTKSSSLTSATDGSTPSSSSTPAIVHPSGPTPYLRQRLPEAVEAERRRTSSAPEPTPSSSDPPSSP